MVHHNFFKLQLKRWRNVPWIFLLFCKLIIGQSNCFLYSFAMGWFLIMIECTEEDIIRQLLIPKEKWMICNNNNCWGYHVNTWWVYWFWNFTYAELNQLPCFGWRANLKYRIRNIGKCLVFEAIQNYRDLRKVEEAMGDESIYILIKDWCEGLK